MTASPTTTRSPDHKRLRNEGEMHEVRPEDMELIPDGITQSPKLSSAALAAAMPVNGDRPTRPAPPSGSRRQAQNQGAGAKTRLSPMRSSPSKAFLIHGEELSLLQSQLALVYKMPVEHGFSRQLLDSVKAWQAGLKKPTTGRTPKAIPRPTLTRRTTSVSSRSWIPSSTSPQRRRSLLTRLSTARLGSTSSGLTSFWTSGLPSTRT